MTTRPDIRTVAGVDAAYDGLDDSVGVTKLVVLRYPELELLHSSEAAMADLPAYRPGHLFQREGKWSLELIQRARRQGVSIDVLFVDGFGTLHPKRFGYACELGAKAGVRTIGVGKNLLQIDGLPSEKEVKAQCRQKLGRDGGGDNGGGVAMGVVVPLVSKVTGETLGAALAGHTAASSNPIYVTAGHGMTLVEALAITRACCKHRIPEPQRLADLEARKAAKSWFGEEGGREGD
mmetsp:Transcript_14053/g.32177  ORF Transcript_14053/g.32177 Transcript_14053/m.32177 type:complete len:235 (-) Transcript_14053:104-808(-)